MGIIVILISFVWEDAASNLALSLSVLFIAIYIIKAFYQRHVTIAADRIIEEQSHEEQSCEQE